VGPHFFHTRISIPSHRNGPLQLISHKLASPTPFSPAEFLSQSSSHSFRPPLSQPSPSSLSFPPPLFRPPGFASAHAELSDEVERRLQEFLDSAEAPEKLAELRGPLAKSGGGAPGVKKEMGGGGRGGEAGEGGAQGRAGEEEEDSGVEIVGEVEATGDPHGVDTPGRHFTCTSGCR
jgi:hypothetical protein